MHSKGDERFTSTNATRFLNLMAHIKLSCMLLVLLSFVSPAVIFACKYNVRDMGFVDLEDRPYLLTLYLGSPYTESDLQRFKRSLQSQLHGTNIRSQVVHRIHQKTHPALSMLDDASADSDVSLLLVDPAGQKYPVWTLDKEKDIEQQVHAIITSIVTSPLRNAIQERSLRIFSVVLLIEGQQEQKNDRFRQMALEAIAEIKLAMGTLPKPISHPPELMTLRWQDRPAEQLLLWSQGLLNKPVDDPTIVILYGRLRRMGPVLNGAEITSEKIISLLSVIGADCECELDRSWLQGEMIPAKWDSDKFTVLTGQLGFDTENPMIKIEISQILQKGRQDAKPPGFEAIKGLKMGYREIEISFDLPESVPNQQETSAQESVPPNSFCDETPKSTPAEQQSGEDEFTLWNPLYVMGAAGLIVLGVALCIIIIRSGRKT